jgi:hypothetical protein
MPRGCALQMGFHRQFERIGKALRLGTVAEALARRAVRREAPSRHPPAHPARSCDPADPVPLALGAFARVVTELGWNRDAERIVFAHTHQPLDGAVGEGCRGVRFWNTGSWIHAPSRTSRGAYANYLRRAWPGTGVLIDTERPEPTLIEMLADRNPANASNGGRRRRSPLGRFVPGPLGVAAAIARDRVAPREPRVLDPVHESHEAGSAERHRLI